MPDQKPSTRKDRSAPQIQDLKSEKAPDQKPPSGKHHPVPQTRKAKSKQVSDQDASAKKHRSHHSRHRPKESKHDAKPIDDLYHHLKKVHVKKGYSKQTAGEIAYHESKKVMDKMERTFRHEMQRYEK